MSIIGAWGFEGQNATRDKIIQFAGSGVTFETGTVPPLGASTCSLKWGTSIGLASVVLDSSPTGSDFWIHLNVNWSHNNTLNNTLRIGWVSVDGVVAGYITRENSTSRLQVWVDGVLRATAAVAVPVGSWKRLHIHVDYLNTGAGFVRVYEDGALSGPPALQWTGNTNPSAYGVIKTLLLGDYVSYWDDLMVLDPNDGITPTDINDIAFTSIGSRVPNVNGTDTTWVATPGAGSAYEDIDEIPNSDAEYIRASAPSQASTFGFQSATFGQPLAIKVKARTVRSGVVAGANLAIRQRLGPTATDSVDVPCPGDGDVHMILHTDANGADWSTVSFDGSEFGVVSKT